MMTTKKLLILVAMAMGIIVAPPIASAQICPGSHLNYIVRDAKGTIIDPGSNDLKFEGDGQYKYWSAGPIHVLRFAGEDLPPEIAKFKDKTVLTVDGMCIFKGDVKLRITFGDKIMSLTFHMPSLGDYESTDFVVDSLPFKAGDYEIILNSRLLYNPAGAWKKAGSRH